jgi:hypothetical protein
VITIYHGTIIDNLVPQYGKGRNYHDYGNGFYTTESFQSACEWACQKPIAKTAYVYEYRLDLSHLKILKLEDNETLQWIAVLMKHRKSDDLDGLSIARCEELVKQYSIDENQYDIIIGYRADDSYFKYSESFVNNTMTLECVQKCLKLGNLGIQICVKSNLAYNKLKFIKQHIIPINEYNKYCNQYNLKDRAARKVGLAMSKTQQTGNTIVSILKAKGYEGL